MTMMIGLHGDLELLALNILMAVTMGSELYMDRIQRKGQSRDNLQIRRIKRTTT